MLRLWFVRKPAVTSRFFHKWTLPIFIVPFGPLKEHGPVWAHTNWLKMKMELHDFRTGISDNLMSGQPEFSHQKKIARGLLDVVAFFVLFCFSCYFHFRDSWGRSDCYSRTMWLLCVSVFFMWDMKVVPPLLPFPGALLQSDRRIFFPVFFPAPSPELQPNDQGSVLITSGPFRKQPHTAIHLWLYNFGQ